MLEPAFDRGRAEPLAQCQTASADSVPVVEEDLAMESFGGALARSHAGEALTEAASAAFAQPLAGFEFQLRECRAPDAFMAQLAQIATFAAQVAAAAPGTLDGAGVVSPDHHSSAPTVLSR